MKRIWTRRGMRRTEEDNEENVDQEGSEKDLGG